MHQPNNSKLFTMAISSFAVHGTASLKTFTRILGSKILPIPTILLNGLTNMQMVKKFEPPFRDLLISSLELAENRKLELILYIGYIGQSHQVDTLLEFIPRYKKLFKTILVDPICGDHSRAYISPSILERLPELIHLADISFPNLTEMKLLSGFDADGKESPLSYMTAYKEKFGFKPFVITSLPFNDIETGFLYFDGKEEFSYKHAKLGANFGGSGDAFLASFLDLHFYQGKEIREALKESAERTKAWIENSIALGTQDLYI